MIFAMPRREPATTPTLRVRQIFAATRSVTLFLDVAQCQRVRQRLHCYVMTTVHAQRTRARAAPVSTHTRQIAKPTRRALHLFAMQLQVAVTVPTQCATTETGAQRTRATRRRAACTQT
jgi:hypothetical protein